MTIDNKASIRTILFQKMRDWVEAEGLEVSMKAEKLHAMQPKRSRVNILFTRVLACSKTSVSKAA